MEGDGEKQGEFSWCKETLSFSPHLVPLGFTISEHQKVMARSLWRVGCCHLMCCALLSGIGCDSVLPFWGLSQLCAVRDSHEGSIVYWLHCLHPADQPNKYFTSVHCVTCQSLDKRLMVLRRVRRGHCCSGVRT